MFPRLSTNGTWARLSGPSVIVWISFGFWPAIVNCTVWPTFALIALGKKALIVNRCPLGARARSTVSAPLAAAAQTAVRGALGGLPRAPARGRGDRGEPLRRRLGVPLLRREPLPPAPGLA